MKRKIAFLLAVTAAVTCLAACGGGEGDTAQTGGGEVAEVANDVQEPLEGYTASRPFEITLMSDTSMEWENGLQDVCDEYEKRTGIKLVD